MEGKRHRAVFMDKDGTLIPNIPYNIDPDLISIASETIDGIRLLKQQGFLLIVVSNQSGIAKGYFTEQALLPVWDRISNLLQEHHLAADAFYYCPHEPGAAVKRYNMICDCRKPMPGLIIKAANEFDIDISSSWMIGDILNDVEAGNRAGCKTILINNGNETEWKRGKNRTPYAIATNIKEAASIIIQRQQLHMQ